jgi:hypothetical protein
MLKKILIFFISLFYPFLVFAQANNNGNTTLDDLSVILYKNGNTDNKEDIKIVMSNSPTASDGYDGGDFQRQDGHPLYHFSTRLNDASRAELITDRRPYLGRYVVEFPLVMKLEASATYTIGISTIKKQNAATICQFIDTQNPDVFIDLLEGDYTSISGSGKYTDRFKIRIYAACLFKKDALNNRWDVSTNWHGTKDGAIPGTGSSDLDKINTCVIIPPEKEVVIPGGLPSLTVWSLQNGGTLSIEENASLTVKGEVILNPLNKISEIYY